MRQEKLTAWRRKNSEHPRVARALTAGSKRSDSASWEAGSKDQRSLGGVAAAAYRRRPSQSVQAMSSELVNLLAKVRLRPHGATLASLGVTTIEQLRVADASVLSTAMLEHGMDESERRRLLRAISMAQAAPRGCTSSWHKQGATLRMH